jgi:phage terminase large subunit-like protein
LSLNIETEQPRRRGRERPSITLPRRERVGKDRADDVIKFIEALTIPSGVGQGQPFKLMDWQKSFIYDIYQPHIDGRRIVRRAVLSIARKCGKTALIAAIVLANLVGPEAIPNGEIYSAANDRDQASIVFKFARQLLEASPILRKLVEIIPSTKTMIAKRTGSIYRAISAEAGTKHGYLPSVCIFDELAQAKNRDLYDVLDTSFGARSEPLFIIISTQSNDPEHILSKLIDDGLSGADPSIICHLYAADEDCDLDDEVQWKKANPALDVFRDREDLASLMARAKRLPAEEPKVRNLFLNQRVSPVSTLISHTEWMACAGEVKFEDGEEVFLALDLSSTTDLTALIMGSAADPCRVRPYFWKPLDLLRDHSNRDFGTGNLRYVQWHAEGHLLATDGRSIDPAAVAYKIGELYQRYKVLGLVYDRWRIDTLLRELDNAGIAAYMARAEPDGADTGLRRFLNAERRRSEGGLRLIPFGQGFRDMAPAIDAFEAAIIERKLVHPSNPALNWNVANAVAATDPAGNRKIDKDKARFRVDGAVALAMLMGVRASDRSGQRTVDIDALIG